MWKVKQGRKCSNDDTSIHYFLGYLEKCCIKEVKVSRVDIDHKNLYYNFIVRFSVIVVEV